MDVAADPNVIASAFAPNDPREIYCSGHTSLSDPAGRVIFVGGGGRCADQHNKVRFFDPTISGAAAWTDGPDESVACRWYASVILLGDGRLLTMDGYCENWFNCSGVDSIATRPSIFDPVAGTWTGLPLAQYHQQPPMPSFDLEYYPFCFALSSGKVFVAGSHYINPGVPADLITRTLDLTTQQWAEVGNPPIKGDTAVMYRKDVIMKAGGALQCCLNPPNPPCCDTNGCPNGNQCEYLSCENVNLTDRVFAINLTQPSPQWVEKTHMIHKRLWFYLIALPDGKVLATGGDSNPICGTNSPVLTPEVFDPYANAPTGTWTQMAPMTDPRMHHSSALLLPTGEVWVAGGEVTPLNGAYNTYQVFKPPYFFQGTRPTICDGPNLVYCGQKFNVTIGTPDASQITACRLIRPGAATHSFDQSQRSMELDFCAATVSSSMLTITAPANGNEAPPGYYMLFVATGTNGSLPSVAHWVRLAPAGTGTATLYDANPPADNPYVSGTQPFRDVLQEVTTALSPQGIGGAGTPNEGAYTYSIIMVKFNGTLSLTPGDIAVNCTYTGPSPCGAPCPKVVSVTPGSESGEFMLTLDRSIPPGGTTEIAFLTAAPGAVLRYESLPGDVNMNGTSTGQDVLSLVTAINNGTAADPANLARYDINRNGTVTGQDSLRLTQLLNGTNATQEWNGASLVAQCSGSGFSGGGDAPSGAGGDSMGPNGGETDGGGEPPWTAEQFALVTAAVYAGCAEASIDAACCQELLDGILP